MQLAGELTKISLPSLIQLLRNGQLTGKVCFTQGANTAFVYVLNGKLVHAETDSEVGRFALLELFLWLSGTFSFVEADVESLEHTLSPEEPAEKFVREGLAYLEKKKLLDQLRISSRTVFRRATDKMVDDQIFMSLDGVKNIGDIVSALGLSRWEYINSVNDLVRMGAIAVVDPPSAAESVQLPAWVISRLQQDNPDVSQAIVQMVIWVDRVKCWMYQADADLDQIVDQLSQQDVSPGFAKTDVGTADGGAVAAPSAGFEF